MVIARSAGVSDPATAATRAPTNNPNTSHLSPAVRVPLRNQGRGCGVGRSLGIGLPLGVGVGRGVEVAVGVAVAVGVGDGVGVAHGVSVYVRDWFCGGESGGQMQKSSV